MKNKTKSGMPVMISFEINVHTIENIQKTLYLLCRYVSKRQKKRSIRSKSCIFFFKIPIISWLKYVRLSICPFLKFLRMYNQCAIKALLVHNAHRVWWPAPLCDLALVIKRKAGAMLSDRKWQVPLFLLNK